MTTLAEAAEALMEIAKDPASPAAAAARLLRQALQHTPPQSLPRLPGNLEFVYLYVGAPERALATYQRRAEVPLLGGPQGYIVWHASYAPARKTELFKDIVRKAGLVEYWRAKGWPPQCHPFGADDFTCE